MQKDFHYYATYCAAILAGYSHRESLQIACSAQLVDCCSRTFLAGIKAPPGAATTQTAAEMAALQMTIHDRMYVTRIWSSFHFLPADLYREVKKGPKIYRQKYRLICGPNGDLLLDTVDQAKQAVLDPANPNSLPAVGIAMHILADTWAHKYFAGTPSLVINNTDYYFKEVLEQEGRTVLRDIHFGLSEENPETASYINSIYSRSEHSVMNLGHGRAGHLPDYSFIHYRYTPAWGDYAIIDKDNPSDYLNAFTQMITALRYLRGEVPSFEKEQYDMQAIEPWRDRIDAILRRRQLDASQDWEALGKDLSGSDIEAFDLSGYTEEYRRADDRSRTDTFLGRFIIAALEQKSMITNKIYSSGNPLAGRSIRYEEEGFHGIRSYKYLIQEKLRGEAGK